MNLKLPSELTLPYVKEWAAKLKAALAAREDVELDTSELEEVDVAGLQLLCSAHRYASENKHALRFDTHGRGAVLEAAMNRAGLARAHGCTAQCFWTEVSHG